MADLPKFEDECFFIAPIGADGSPERERSDGILEYIVTPSAAAVDLVAVRADQIGQPGIITRQVIEHVVLAKAAVIDLTGENPNVYYEMAVRHTAKLPTVLIADKDQKLPFDIQQMRTIFFDYQSLKSASDCKVGIIQHLEEAIAGAVDSPVASSVTLQTLEQGNPQDKVLANLVSTVEDLSRDVRSVAERVGHVPDDGIAIHPSAIRDLVLSSQKVDECTQDSEDPDLRDAVSTLKSLTSYFRDISARRGPRAARAKRLSMPPPADEEAVEEE